MFVPISFDDWPNKAPREAHQSYNTILHLRSSVPLSHTVIMGESIELIEGDHILEPVEEAVAMYEDLLTDLRKFLVTISHSFVTLHLFQAYALFRGPPKCMMH